MKTIRRSPSQTMHKKVEKSQLSSCDCHSCKNFYILDKQTEKNCNISPYFQCYNRLTFKNQIEPSTKCGYDIINPQGKTTCIDKKYNATSKNMPHVKFNKSIVIYGRNTCPYCIGILKKR